MWKIFVYCITEATESTVRSAIDYAASVLTSFLQKDLYSLEKVQNDAMRIILGCVRITRREIIMRLEFRIPSIFFFFLCIESRILLSLVLLGWYGEVMMELYVLE